jgi:hypothetical protein
MDCKKCGTEMKQNKWVTGHWFSEWAAGEFLFLLLVIPLLTIGIVGWVIFGLIIIGFAFYSRGKTWYKCPNCKSTEMQKL